MNAHDWIDLLPLVAHRGWEIDAVGYVRDRDGFCPICALANEVDSSFKLQTYFWHAAERLGLRDAGQDAIARAADSPSATYRRSLLRALGLEFA